MTFYIRKLCSIRYGAYPIANKQLSGRITKDFFFEYRLSQYFVVKQLGEIGSENSVLCLPVAAADKRDVIPTTYFYYWGMLRRTAVFQLGEASSCEYYFFLYFKLNPCVLLSI